MQGKDTRPAEPQDRSRPEGDSGAETQTLWHLIAAPEVARPSSDAILAPGRTPLSHGHLIQALQENVAVLRRAGVGVRDRIAVVLPNGPEMAVAMLATMVTGAAAPLNPNYSREEFDFYLSDLEAGALLVQAGTDHHARSAAKARGIPVIELCPESAGPAGFFRLNCPVLGPPSRDPLPRPSDIALLLHTSGTTSRPKLVPLTHSNLYFSSRSIQEGLQLTAEDRCLNVMPLFHVHGLVAALLSSLSARGSLVCAPGFLANEFLGWLRDLLPTWYTAVPTIHQAVLARLDGSMNTPVTHRLRFIRSCSASLPPAVMSDLERFFRVPVVEAYGMTEAAHQMACNPLPPFTRKPGSVGLPTGVEISILAETGDPLPVGKTGEVAVHGRTVTSGYLKNPEANARGFLDGWLRTGDMGHLDADGYLFLDGRSKEIINRGGEKISPREIEDVLLSHPGIAQAVAFALPDEHLGEDVGAAVVLRPGVAADEIGVRGFAGGKLAYFKVPKRVIFVSEIPKGATGKPQRIGLARTLGLASAMNPRPDTRGPARNEPESCGKIERRILDRMREILGREDIGISGNFFEAGGDSVQAAVILAEVKRQFGTDIPITRFILTPTAGFLAQMIRSGEAAPLAALVPIKRSGSKPPFFCVHPHDGRVSLFYPLAKYFDEDQPFCALQVLSEEDLRPAAGGIERLALRYIGTIKTFRPDGPYLLGGYCFGALVAFEMARILAQRKEPVSFLALIDSYAPGCPAPSTSGRLRGKLYAFLDQVRRVRPMLGYISHLPPKQRTLYLRRLLRRESDELRSMVHGAKTLSPEPYSLPGRESDRDWRYRPAPYPGPAVLFRPTAEPLGFEKSPAMGWDGLINGPLEIEPVNGYHRSLIFKPHNRSLATTLSRRLRNV